jgi:hypothetical protein
MPERSENIPPSAAKIKGVANLMVENIRANVKISLIFLNYRTIFKDKEFAND